MSTTVLEKLCSERDEARAAAVAMAESDQFNPEDKTFLDLKTRASELDGRVAALADLIESRSAADNPDGKLAKAAQHRQREAEKPRELATRASWGEMFVRSDEFAGYRGRGTSPIMTVDLAELQTRALPTGLSDMVAAGLKPAAYGVDVTPPVPPTPLMDNVTQISVSSNAIEYVSWAKIAGGAAKVAEKAAKPSAEWKPTVTSSTLDTWAVYTQLTRQLIEDMPAVRSYIDGQLRYDVARAEEADAVAVLAAAAATIPDAVDPDLMKAIRIGIGTVEAAGYSPTAVLLNPADWAMLDITVLQETNAGPVRSRTFWGLTAIPANAQPAGTAVVGDFRSAIHHYTRSQIALYVTDSHADTFLANVFTLLAERRGKTAVVRPQALVEAKTA
jgi:HK97 family phage major capsid protein